MAKNNKVSDEELLAAIGEGLTEEQLKKIAESREKVRKRFEEKMQEIDRATHQEKEEE